MANSRYFYRELRIIFEAELTQVYVYLDDPTGSDNPIGVLGWHHKTFPASMSSVQIITGHIQEAVMWPHSAPPDSRNGGSQFSWPPASNAAMLVAKPDVDPKGRRSMNANGSWTLNDGSVQWPSAHEVQSTHEAEVRQRELNKQQAANTPEVDVAKYGVGASFSVAGQVVSVTKVGDGVVLGTYNHPDEGWGEYSFYPEQVTWISHADGSPVVDGK